MRCQGNCNLERYDRRDRNFRMKRTRQRFEHERLHKIKDQLDGYVNNGLMVGGGIQGVAGKQEYLFTSGYLDLAQTKPFTEDTIIRQASDTKLMGVVAFLKLVENGVITGKEEVANWIPAFANTKVINPKFPSVIASLTNPLTATQGSSILNVNHPSHGLSTNNYIALEYATPIQNIPVQAINKIHQVTVVDPDNYTIDVSISASLDSPAPEGGSILVKLVDSSTKQRFYFNSYFYYSEDDLDRPITIWHILTHTVGYLYNNLTLGAVFGYADGTEGDPTKKYVAAIQASIMQDKLLPVAFPDKRLPLSSSDIKTWSNVLAEVPLLFQPGTDWSYGPVLSVLGALIEYIDGRPFEQYFKEELTDPLEMNSTGFFIKDSDPNRNEKLDRIQPLYLSLAPGVFVPANLAIPGADIEGYFYDSNQPRTLALIDGGSYSTLADRHKFYKMLLHNGHLPNGDYFISPATISLLSHNRIRDLTTLELFPPLTNFKWSVGVAVTAGADDVSTLTSETKRAIFWSGAFGTAFNVDFGNDTLVNFVNNVAYVYFPLPFVRSKIFSIHASSVELIEANDEDVMPNPSGSIN